jgi:hypothetical protein
MKVHNVNGTAANTCKCGSWLQHWRRFSGQALPTYCPEKTCLKKPAVGAHVQRDGFSDRSWYIVPVCEDHNRQVGAALDLQDTITLVSANVGQTCGKWY